MCISHTGERRSSRPRVQSPTRAVVASLSTADRPVDGLAAPPGPPTGPSSRAEPALACGDGADACDEAASDGWTFLDVARKQRGAAVDRFRLSNVTRGR